MSKKTGDRSCIVKLLASLGPTDTSIEDLVKRTCPRFSDADVAMFRECPLCAERMHLETRETVTRVPGTSQEIRTIIREWICGECDYFEEADDLGAAIRE